MILYVKVGVVGFLKIINHVKDVQCVEKGLIVYNIYKIIFYKYYFYFVGKVWY